MFAFARRRSSGLGSAPWSPSTLPAETGHAGRSSGCWLCYRHRERQDPAQDLAAARHDKHQCGRRQDETDAALPLSLPQFTPPSLTPLPALACIGTDARIARACANLPPQLPPSRRGTRSRRRAQDVLTALYTGLWTTSRPLNTSRSAY